MKLYYYSVRGSNFGDDLNTWMWPKVISQPFDNNEEQYFIGIGTLINNRLNNNIPKNSQKIIFGSGVGMGKPARIDETWKIYFVRGPLSSNKLGIAEDTAITDPAILIRLLDYYSYGPTFKFSYMPHHKSEDIGNWQDVCALSDINYISPSWSVEKVLDHISRTEILLTEAMHGAIVADALRIPWIPITSSKHIFPFKWVDWASSLNLDYKPNEIDFAYKHGLYKQSGGLKKYIAKRLLISVNIKNDEWKNQIYKDASSQMICEQVSNRLLYFANNCEPQLSKDSELEINTEKCLSKISLFEKDCLKKGINISLNL